jgi:hypothetical protein
MTAEQTMLATCVLTERTDNDLDRADAAMHSQMSDLTGDREGHGPVLPQATLLFDTPEPPGTRPRNLLDWDKFDAERSRKRLLQQACQRLEGR